MKVARLFFVLGFLILLLVSCPDPGADPAELEYDPSQDPLYGDFWAENAATGRYYRLEADMVFTGTHCEIWVEKGSGVTPTMAEEMARVYDEEIYPAMTEVFDIGRDEFTFQGKTVGSTMEVADLMGDENGKLIILLLDIKDGYTPQNASYVAGYYSLLDLFSFDYPKYYADYSNKCDMIYVDTYPNKIGSLSSNATIAHEMQHLMNRTNSEILKSEKKRSGDMELWINEGLSGAAEWVYASSLAEPPEEGVHSLSGRLEWFNEDSRAFIDSGNNFYVWGNLPYYYYNPEYIDYALQDDYATVYLFFQWLRLQAPDNIDKQVYNRITTSNRYDFGAVTGAMDMGTTQTDWNSLLRDWLAANYINAPTGRHGYKNDEALKNIKAKTIDPSILEYFKEKAIGFDEYHLYPGEAVYTFYKTGVKPTDSFNIGYAAMTRGGSDYNAGSSITEEQTLLTFNKNNKNAPIGILNGRNLYEDEPGTITGNYDPLDYPETTTTANIRSAAARHSTLSGPFRVSMDDMRRINQYKDKNKGRSVFDTAKFQKEITVNE